MSIFDLLGLFSPYLLPLVAIGALTTGLVIYAPDIAQFLGMIKESMLNSNADDKFDG